ncbi:MAG: hypothetical protein A2161_10390 [Candidatus Schekmanbacteria bacterium RBG_13_48_7]|uniref:histidine kinase n=1 Tax=Candidatus Schekmanbacteria bacterium RBG_13_48_7 TaxID=1817878 RepID=A0A1F7RPC9_9BACT|nr:MAG: hypothetical protein A2161_10390 [Candidatus Schekmanbacteria bacterium RBG_13_48_7]
MTNILLKHILSKNKVKKLFDSIGEFLSWNIFVFDQQNNIFYKKHFRKDPLTKAIFSGKPYIQIIKKILLNCIEENIHCSQHNWFLCEFSNIAFGCIPLKIQNRKLGHCLFGPFFLNNDKNFKNRSNPLINELYSPELLNILKKLMPEPPEEISLRLKYIHGILNHIIKNNYSEYSIQIKYKEFVDKSFQELQEKNIELEQAVTKLKEFDQLKSDFLSNVSHELRTPLTPIIAYTELLLEDDLSNAQRDYLKIILENSEHLYELIQDLLTISKLESGKLKLVHTKLYFPVILERSLETVRHIADGKQILITTDYPPSIPLIIGDETRLQQILNNLINNAVKFTPDNGRITIKVEPMQNYTSDISNDIKNRDSQFEKMLTITISDTGIGIPPNKIHAIFDRFHQVDGSSTREYSGVGLGLNIVKNLVELHGGKIWVISSPGVGSSFSFTIPIAEPDKIKILTESQDYEN